MPAFRFDEFRDAAMCILPLLEGTIVFCEVIHVCRQ
jgi:hypothetical protein